LLALATSQGVLRSVGVRLLCVGVVWRAPPITNTHCVSHTHPPLPPHHRTHAPGWRRLPGVPSPPRTRVCRAPLRAAGARSRVLAHGRSISCWRWPRHKGCCARSVCACCCVGVVRRAPPITNTHCVSHTHPSLHTTSNGTGTGSPTASSAAMPARDTRVVCVVDVTALGPGAQQPAVLQCLLETPAWCAWLM
jgi:hypothetical protein